MLTLPELSERLGRFTATAFRLELLPVYTSASDGGDVARYLRGEAAPDPERKEAWLSQLRAERDQGRVRQRVHVLASPIGGYLRYECEWGYAPNAAAGEDVRILDLAERSLPAALAGIDHDFWLIDDAEVIVLHYDQDGRFTAAELLADTALPRYRAARDAALAAAEPFGPWWRRHPESHQVNHQAA